MRRAVLGRSRLALPPPRTAADPSGNPRDLRGDAGRGAGPWPRRDIALGRRLSVVLRTPGATAGPAGWLHPEHVAAMSLARYKDLCIDASDPAALGRFYAAALGLDLHVDDDGDAHLTGPTDRHTVWINGVPEPKTVKNR